jgi:hypothetical protein
MFSTWALLASCSLPVLFDAESAEISHKVTTNAAAAFLNN